MRAEALGFAVYCAACSDRAEAAGTPHEAVRVAREAGYRDVRGRGALCPACRAQFTGRARVDAPSTGRG